MHDLRSGRDIYLSSITDADGKSVNVGYLWIHRKGKLDVAMSIAAFAAAFGQMYFDVKHEFPFVVLAATITAIWGTFGAALAALGVFVVRDRAPGLPSIQQGPAQQINVSAAPQ